MTTQEERDRMLAEYLALHGSDDEGVLEAIAACERNSNGGNPPHRSYNFSDEDDDSNVIPTLSGTLSKKISNGVLLFKGSAGDDDFTFYTLDEQYWDCYNPTVTTPKNVHFGMQPPLLRTVEMLGFLAHKPVSVTLHITAEPHMVILPAPRSLLQQQQQQKEPDGKSAPCDTKPSPQHLHPEDCDVYEPLNFSEAYWDDDEQKIPAEEKKDSDAFDVMGRGQEMNGPQMFEFFGTISRNYMDMGYHLDDESEIGQVPLNCHLNFTLADSKLPPEPTSIYPQSYSNQPPSYDLGPLFRMPIPDNVHEPISSNVKAPPPSSTVLKNPPVDRNVPANLLADNAILLSSCNRNEEKIGSMSAVPALIPVAPTHSTVVFDLKSSPYTVVTKLKPPPGSTILPCGLKPPPNSSSSSSYTTPDVIGSPVTHQPSYDTNTIPDFGRDHPKAPPNSALTLPTVITDSSLPTHSNVPTQTTTTTSTTIIGTLQPNTVSSSSLKSAVRKEPPDSDLPAPPAKKRIPN